MLFLQTKQLKIFILVYVDDILLIGTDTLYIDELVSNLDSQFALKRLGELSYFLVFEVERTKVRLLLKQSKYAYDLLVKTRIHEAIFVPTPLIMGEKLYIGDSELFEDPTLYRSIIGFLQYLTMTRLGLSFSVNKLSQFLKAPTQL